MQFRTILAAFALAASAAPFGVAALTFPGAAPCDTTLQACITGAASGDVIEIATNTAIDESLAINKSLTLRPAVGFTPTIGGGVTFRTLDFGGLGASGSAETLLIEGLRFQQAQARGLVYQASGHSITIRDNVFFLEIANNNTPAVEIDDRVPLTGVISGNRITSIGQGIRLWAITAVGEVVDYTVERNVIDTSLPAESNIGISFDLRGAGTYNVRALSNVIDRVGGCNCGGNAGLSILVLDTPQVVASINNNTIQGTQTASGFDVRVIEAGAAVTINLFNNIVSFGDRAGFVFDDSGVATITLVAGRNDSFGNAEADNFDGLPSGTVLNTNPQFLDAAAGNLRLQPSSQLVNAGVNAPAGGNSALDADGLARIQGGTIDVGAYEQAIRTQPEVPVPVAGPAGLAALALLLLAAAGTTLWRRASRR